MKKISKILSGVLLVITFVMVLFLVATKAQGEAPEIFGFQVLRISSPSMTPVLNEGDIILSKRVKDVRTIEIGDIITYEGTVGSYADKKITHEVIVAPYESDGKYYLHTWGVNNGYVDAAISEDQVIGIMVCELPAIAALYDFFRTPWGLVVTLGFLGVFFVNELMNLIKLMREKDDEEDEKESENSEDASSENAESSESEVTVNGEEGIEDFSIPPLEED